MTASTPPNRRPEWKALAAHHEAMRGVHLRELFAKDPGRGERLVAEAAGLYLDYSKQRVTDETLRLLLDLARACGVPRAHAVRGQRRVPPKRQRLNA